MILTEKETTAIEDLKTQEQACIEKYTKYSLWRIILSQTDVKHRGLKK